MRSLRPYALTCVVVGSAFLVTYVSTVRTRVLFGGDTRYYAAMALHFGGTDQQTAAAKVSEYAAHLGFATPPADVLFGWGLVQPRVVMPALSAPFVKVFGIPGLAVVPGIALVLLTALLTGLLLRRYGAGAAMATMLVLLASPQLVFYGSAMLTEGLAALWVALLVVVAWRYQRTPSLRGVVLMVALTVVLGFTRQSTLIPAGAFVVAWLAALVARRRPNPWRVPALAVAATSVGVQVVQMLAWPGFSQLTQFEHVTHTDSLLHALRATPRLAWHILHADVMYMVRSDHGLLILLTLAVVSMVVLWRREESHLLLGALLATELYGVTNGTPTVFRYGTPGLVFVAASVALLVSRAAAAAGHPPPPEAAAGPGEPAASGTDMAAARG